MGQLFLGFRSLLVKVGVFVVLAALLAWALGGTLWPRPETAKVNAVEFAGKVWYWELAVGGAESGRVEWTLKRRGEPGQAESADTDDWIEVAGPIVAHESLVYAGRLRKNNPDDSWMLVRLSAEGTRQVQHLPDRLAVEQHFVRLRGEAGGVD